MCVLIDQDFDNFAQAISDLQTGPCTWSAESDAGYGIRKSVCEKSRFVWLSTKQAADGYPGVLEGFGPDGTIRARRASDLFTLAINLLACQDDVFLQKVRERYEEVRPQLDTALEACGAAAAPS